VILDGVDRLGVAGVAKARMIGDDDRVPLRPIARHLEAGEGAGAVQEHQRRAASDAVNDGPHAVDRMFRAGEAGEIGRGFDGIKHGRLRLKAAEPGVGESCGGFLATAEK
jgi:hypothetical protein